MNIKKILSFAFAVPMIISAISAPTFAAESVAISSDTSHIVSEEPDYISFDEYLNKYGEENVIRGLNKAEAENQATVLSIGNEETAVDTHAEVNAVSNEPNDIFLSLSEGKFLGMEILGVSDLPPDDMRLSVRLKNDSFSSPPDAADLEENSKPASVNAENKLHYTNYDVYYSNDKPGSTDLAQAFESLRGSYVYKYSYAFNNYYFCSTDVTFSNAQLKCGTQNNNMYTYLAAKSNSQTLDFGLMANPAASNRNKGMYAFYNDPEKGFTVEVNPKVSASSYNLTNKTMTLANTTVQIRLSVDNGTAEMCLRIGNTDVFYKVINVSSFKRGNGNAMTFVQAMSCPEANGNSTSLTSGSYFKNVKFSNTQLYRVGNSSPYAFSTFGSNTYYVFLCRPTKLSFDYANSSNTETISINYN